MKKILISILLVMGFSIPVNASLIDLLNGVIQDDRGTATSNDDTYWIQDLNRFVGMTYDEQISAIEGLDNQGVSGITDFHMASYSDMLSLLDLNSLEEIVEVFTPMSQYESIMWRARTTRYYNPGAHYMYLIDYGPPDQPPVLNGRFVGVWDYATSPGAWVVAYRDVGPPIADCGQERAVVFDSIALDGSGSSDPEGLPLLYEWTLQHEDGSIITAYGSNPTISDLPSGFVDVYLTVTDDEGLTDTDTMILAVAGQYPDEDEDGELDITDLCADTPPDTDVDGDGCSLVQFCKSIDTSIDQQICNRSDWKNDEPLDNKGDCKAIKEGQGPSNYLCLPR